MPAVALFVMLPMHAWIRKTDYPQVVVLLGPNRVRQHRHYHLSAAGWRGAGVGIAQAKKHTLSVLFAAGHEEGGDSEAQLMAQTVESYWPEAVVWLEEEGLNTWQKAQSCAAHLTQKGMRRVLLVTDRAHLPRAMYA